MAWPFRDTPPTLALEYDEKSHTRDLVALANHARECAEHVRHLESVVAMLLVAMAERKMIRLVDGLPVQHRLRDESQSRKDQT